MPGDFDDSEPTAYERRVAGSTRDSKNCSVCGHEWEFAIQEGEQVTYYHDSGYRACVTVEPLPDDIIPVDPLPQPHRFSEPNL
jgi:hypothetical protein